MKWLAVVLLALLGLVEFIVRAVVAIVLVCTILGIFVLEDYDVLACDSWELAARIVDKS